jgi:hypothetical protein
VYVEPLLHPCDEADVVMVNDLSDMLLDSVCIILFRKLFFQVNIKNPSNLIKNTNRQLKNSLASIISIERQTQTRVIYTNIPVRMAIIISVRKDVEKMKPLCTFGENVN